MNDIRACATNEKAKCRKTTGKSERRAHAEEALRRSYQAEPLQLKILRDGKTA